MTNYTPQASASDRYEAARRALADYDAETRFRVTEMREYADSLASALRALITPPPRSRGSATEAAIRVLEELARRDPFIAAGIQKAGLTRHVRDVVAEGVLAGIRSVEDPTQEQMLRWLGIEYMEFGSNIHIPEQDIEREEI